MYRLLSFLLCLFLILYSFPAYGSPFAIQTPLEDKPLISAIEKGEKAPFDGTIFNKTAVANLIVDKETAKKQCEIEKNKEVDTANAKMQLKLDNEKAARMAAERRAEEIGAIKDKQIVFLENAAIKNSKAKSRQTGWLVGGIVGGFLLGIVATVGGTYALSELRR